ncbi:type III pantothenate kinase [Chitiniphilus eburneus]|uniref:Type III pantothenate kinase n=1 Tax=Chitiniphilus eburneus TaxID=2571148 RepID=A0A4U0PUE9_9NEIS|nr:type III pantothenate kinase [Chitiniphilus eburneus]TJZ72057.1 type III pantothenate kinase [Chitiniphilus eburneus]
MHLFLDLGNTRLKWALASDIFSWHGNGHAMPDELEALFDALRAITAPDAIHGCCVGTETLRQALDAFCRVTWGRDINWLAPSAEAMGVVNRYRKLSQQGPDRWAAVLGARARYPGRALVIASAGTALTIDGLTADGTFLGGMILPGYRMMKTSLAAGTARLPFADGHFHDFPTSTEDAIETGVLTALTASVAALFDRLEMRGEDPLVLLAGGDAPLLSERLGRPSCIAHDLVLQGLAALAFASGEPAI